MRASVRRGAITLKGVEEKRYSEYAPAWKDHVNIHCCSVQMYISLFIWGIIAWYISLYVCTYVLYISIFLYIYKFMYPRIYLSIYLSVYQSIYLSIYLSTWLGWTGCPATRRSRNISTRRFTTHISALSRYDRVGNLKQLNNVQIMYTKVWLW